MARPIARLHATTRNVWAAATTLQQEGRLVSSRAIMALTGIPSTASVHRHLIRLERAGYITRTPRTQGTLRVRIPLFTREEAK